MIAQRAFPDYAAYVHTQGGKARGRRDFLLKHLPKATERFTQIFRTAAPYLTPGAVLCLGARTGAESLGALAAGFKRSVGIDLHPVGPTVMQADWHDLPFPSGSFANVYCNSVDHCLYLDRLAAQVQRVLIPDGRFYVMATNRRRTSEQWRQKPGAEAMFWETSDELIAAICGYGFTVQTSWRDGKWGHYVLGVQ